MSYERNLQAVLGGRLSLPPEERYPTAEELEQEVRCFWHWWAGEVAALPDFWAAHVRGWLEVLDLDLCEEPCWAEEWDSMLAAGEAPAVAIAALMPLVRRAYPLAGPSASFWARPSLSGIRSDA